MSEPMPWPKKPQRESPQPPETNYWRYNDYVGHVDSVHQLYKNDVIKAYRERLLKAVALLKDSRRKLSNIATGAEDDHDGFTYEEIGQIAEQGVHAIYAALLAIGEIPE